MKLLAPHDFLRKGRHKYFLLTSNALFFCLFMVLAFNQKLATDDFYFLSNVQQHGLLKGVVVEYQAWSTRYASLMVNYLVLFLFQKSPWIVPVFSICSLFLLLTAVHLNLTRVVALLHQKKILKKLPSGSGQINLSFFCVSVLFITTLNVGEVWFWLCATCTYLWSVMMLLFVVAWIIKPSTSLFFRFISILALLYIGGSSGPLALVFIGVIVIALTFHNRLNLHIVFNLNKKKFNYKLIIALLICGLAFMVLYFGEGNRIRESFFKSISLAESMVLNVKMTGIIFIKRLPIIVALVSLFCFPLLFIFPTKQKAEPINALSFYWFKLAAVFISIVFLYQWSITLKTQDVAAYRALFFITVLLCGFVGYAYAVAGKNRRFPSFFTSLFYLSLFAGPVLFSLQLYQQTRIVFTYAHEVDERMSLLMEQKMQANEVIELPALPPSGMLYSAEISENPNHHSNQHLQKALKLDVGIKKKAAQ